MVIQTFAEQNVPEDEDRTAVHGHSEIDDVEMTDPPDEWGEKDVVAENKQKNKADESEEVGSALPKKVPMTGENGLASDEIAKGGADVVLEQNVPQDDEMEHGGVSSNVSSSVAGGSIRRVRPVKSNASGFGDDGPQKKKV